MHWSTWSKPFFGITGALALLQIAQANSAQGTAEVAPVGQESYAPKNDPVVESSGEDDYYKPIRHDIRRQVDPCTAASKLTGGRIPYEIAKACLDADFPFPSNLREETAKTVKTLISSFFVFDDLAARPPSGDNVKGLNFTPVNIAGAVDQLLEQSQRSFAANDEVDNLGVADDDDDDDDDEDDDEDEDEDDKDDGESENEGTVTENNQALDSTIEQETEPASLAVTAALFPMTHREFHDGLSSILGKARDGHLSYDADCFRPFEFKLGFYMSHFVRDGKTVLKVHAVDPYFAETNRLNQDILNCDVVKIGGKNAADYIQQWADKHVSESKDPNVRFNMALVRPKYSTLDSDSYLYGSFAQQFKLPEGPSLAFEFQCPGYFFFWPVAPIKANVKWTASYRGQPFRDTLSYYKANCIKPDFDGSEIGNEQGLKDNTEKMFGQDTPKKADEKMTQLSQFTSQQLPVVKYYDDHGSGTQDVDWTPDATSVRELYRGKQGISALLLSDDKTGIITVPSVEPEDSNMSFSDFASEWVNSVIQAINTLRPRAENLILDLSHNGGGYICVGSTLMNLFFPDRPRSVTNIRQSPIANQMMKIGALGVSGFISSYGNSTAAVFDDDVFPSPITHPHRPNMIFTDYLEDRCPIVDQYELKVDPVEESKRRRASSSSSNKVYRPWDPENMAILTNGYCGSTCSLISNMMHTKFGVKTVVIGGKSLASVEKMSYSTFPGLQVIDDALIFDQIRKVEKLKEDLKDPEGSERGVPQGDESKTQKPLSVGNNKEEKEDEDGDNTKEKDVKDEKMKQEPKADDDGRPEYKELDVPYPANFAHKSRIRLTWRQIYHTGDTLDQFVYSQKDDKYRPAWGDVEQWNEYSFIPADKRIDYTENNVHSAALTWVETRDAVWGPSE
ncbi:hypothetical protein BGZ67_007067 [Mortierella alpina]|nr:hypothetical protein BGZ67_007067 [Mortierella alpina]